MKKLLAIIITLHYSLLTIHLCEAQVIHIPADYPTIQQGIDTANEGDTVLVHPGTYVENLIIDSLNITLASLALTTGDTSYISRTIIDGNHTESVIRMTNVDSNMVLCGFTITNGYANQGGGINMYAQSPPELVWLHVTSNEIYGVWPWNFGFGGGIHANMLNLKHSKIRNNFGSIVNYMAYGGGIYIGYGSDEAEKVLQCEDVEITGNEAYYGGGLALQGQQIFAESACLSVGPADGWRIDDYRRGRPGAGSPR